MSVVRRETVVVVLPHLPEAKEALTLRLLAELARDRDVSLCAAGPSPSQRAALGGLDSQGRLAMAQSAPAALAAGLAEALLKTKPSAALVIDHPSTRGCLDELSRRAPRLPRVLVGLSDAPAFCAPGGLITPKEAWLFGAKRTAASLPGALPEALHRAARPERAWLDRRLSALGAPAPRPRLLASVIVPCWNGLRWTKPCLRSVLAHTPRPFELIVIDNASTDGTAAYVRSLRPGPGGRVRLIANKENLGFGKAINQGMLAARGEHLVWLNNDAVVTAGWLERLRGWALRAPWVGAVGPYTNEIEGVQRASSVSYSDLGGLSAFAAAWSLREHGRARRAHRLTGFCLLITRAALRQVGLLDERFGLGCYEDFDYCLRLRQAGFELLLAEDVFIHHQGHQSFTGNGASHLDQSRINREVFIDKWCRRGLEFLDDLDPILAPKR